MRQLDLAFGQSLPQPLSTLRSDRGRIGQLAVEAILSPPPAAPGGRIIDTGFAILSGVLSIVAGLLILLWPAGVVVVALWIVAIILDRRSDGRTHEMTADHETIHVVD